LQQRSALQRALRILGLVRLDLPVDLGAMRAGVGPSVDQILGAQGWVRVQDLSVAETGTARLLKEPHGDARPHDDHIAAAHTGDTLDAREGIAQVPRDPLEDLRLLGAAEVLKELSDMDEIAHG